MDVAERKGLWFSVLLRPDLRPQETTRFTVASATALRRAIQSETGLEPEIKWPNDILIGGKKVAGILTELSAELDRVRHVILGIGVDVNQTAGEFPPELRTARDFAQDRIGPGDFATGTGGGDPARSGLRLRADLLGQVHRRRRRMGGALRDHRK